MCGLWCVGRCGKGIGLGFSVNEKMVLRLVLPGVMSCHYEAPGWWVLLDGFDVVEIDSLVSRIRILQNNSSSFDKTLIGSGDVWACLKQVNFVPNQAYQVSFGVKVFVRWSSSMLKSVFSGPFSHTTNLTS